MSLRDNSPTISKNDSGSYMKGIRIVHYKNDVNDWYAEISEAVFSEDETVATMKGITVRYPVKGVTIHSKFGIYHPGTGKIRLRGKVRGTGKDFTFQSEKMNYLSSEDILNASEGLVIKNDKFYISGERGSIKDSEIMEVKGNVKAVFH
jgi:hypothetical protein